MDNNKPRIHGVPAPKGNGWLKGVKVDAARAAIQHLKEQKERDDFKLAKANGITPEEILAQGRRDLGLVEEVEEVEEDDFDDLDDVKPLSQMNKKELLQVAEEEGVAVEENMTNKQLVEAIKAKREEN